MKNNNGCPSALGRP